MIETITWETNEGTRIALIVGTDCDVEVGAGAGIYYNLYSIIRRKSIMPFKSIIWTVAIPFSTCPTTRSKFPFSCCNFMTRIANVYPFHKNLNSVIQHLSSTYSGSYRVSRRSCLKLGYNSGEYNYESCRQECLDSGPLDILRSC